mgnify:CR=1 FL=1
MTKLLQTTTGIHIAIFRFEYDSRFKRPYTATLPGNTEFGGKLFDDFHASRVLPGFQPDSKMRMLMQLSDQAEIVIVISAEDIEKNKVRGDLGITYDVDVLR